MSLPVDEVCCLFYKTVPIHTFPSFAVATVLLHENTIRCHSRSECMILEPGVMFYQGL